MKIKMNDKVFRGSTLGMTLFGCFMSIVFIVFSVWSFYLFTIEPMPAGVRIFICVLDGCLLLFGVWYLIESLLSYGKQLRVSDDQLVLIRPFHKRRVLSPKELSCWGCVAYAPRSTMLFFCTADQHTILNYLETHRPLCQRIFGTNRIYQLEQSTGGLFRLAVGTWLHRCLFFPRQDVFILNHCTPDRLKALVNSLKSDALITGPWLVDTMDGWESYAKHTTSEASAASSQ